MIDPQKYQALRRVKDHPQYRHGMSKSRQYRIWAGMIVRCYDKSSKSYMRYGGRGIKLSDEWRADFVNFWNDMKDTYFEGASIDRIDNSKGYSKENCRWVVKADQGKNKTTVPLYTHNGVTLTASDWDKKLGFKEGTVRARIKKYGYSIEEALTEEKPKYARVYFDKARKKYRVQAKIKGKYNFIGRFDTKEEALQARADFLASILVKE